MASLVRVWISFAESETPAVYRLNEKAMMIGREESCDIPVIDSSVSRNHGSIAFEAGQYVLRDHGSSNGTHVNGEAIRFHILKHGDTIRLGSVVFLFHDEEVSGEDLQEIQEKAVRDLESTSAQPIHQVPIPPEQNNPVKVMISNTRGLDQLTPSEGQYYTSRTIPISVSRPPASISSAKANAKALSMNDDSFASYLWGCCGFLGMIPAIIYGHMAIPSTRDEEKNQTKGLIYGYCFLFLSMIGLLFFSIYGDKISVKLRNQEIQAVLTAPYFKNGFKLLQGPVLSSPTRRQIQVALDKPPEDPKELRAFKQIYGELLAHWENGLVIYEPELIKVIPAFNEKDQLKFVFEDIFTKPNFLDYNSTVVPEKKDPIGPYLLPSLTSWMFFARDQNLQAQIERFNGEEFPWRNAYRGMKWMGDRFDFNASQIPDIRLFFILKPAMMLYPLTIHTREGNLNSDFDQTYRINYVPAEYLAIVVYTSHSREVLAIHTNSSVFEDAQKELMAKSLIRASLSTILDRKTYNEAFVPSSFSLIPLSEALRKYPVPAKGALR